MRHTQLHLIFRQQCKLWLAGEASRFTCALIHDKDLVFHTLIKFSTYQKGKEIHAAISTLDMASQQILDFWHILLVPYQEASEVLSTI
jgi:hypothetical protein